MLEKSRNDLHADLGSQHRFALGQAMGKPSLEVHLAHLSHCPGQSVSKCRIHVLLALHSREHHLLAQRLPHDAACCHMALHICASGWTFRVYFAGEYLQNLLQDLPL